MIATTSKHDCYCYQQVFWQFLVKSATLLTLQFSSKNNVIFACSSIWSDTVCSFISSAKRKIRRYVCYFDHLFHSFIKNKLFLQILFRLTAVVVVVEQAARQPGSVETPVLAVVVVAEAVVAAEAEAEHPCWRWPGGIRFPTGVARWSPPVWLSSPSAPQLRFGLHSSSEIWPSPENRNKKWILLLFL